MKDKEFEKQDWTTLPLISKDDILEMINDTITGTHDWNIAKSLQEIATREVDKPNVCVSCLKTYPKDIKTCTNEFHSMWSGQQ